MIWKMYDNAYKSDFLSSALEIISTRSEKGPAGELR